MPNINCKNNCSIRYKDLKIYVWDYDNNNEIYLINNINCKQCLKVKSSTWIVQVIMEIEKKKIRCCDFVSVWEKHPHLCVYEKHSISRQADCDKHNQPGQ